MHTMKILSLTVAVLLLASCNHEKLSDPETLKANIDQLPFTEKVFELSVDSAGSVLDTLSIKKVKRNQSNLIVYKEVELDKSKPFKTKAYYYDAENYFYLIQESEQGERVLCNYKYLNTHNDEVKSVYTHFKSADDSISHTALADIEYNADGKKTSAVVEIRDSVLQSTLYFTYNEFEDVTTMTMVNKGMDTTSFGTYTYNYEDGMMREKRIASKGKNKWKANYVYDENGFLVFEERINPETNPEGKVEINYINDNAGNVISAVKTVYPKGYKTYKKFVRIPL